jgi:hypothetical protein
MSSVFVGRHARKLAPRPPVRRRTKVLWISLLVALVLALAAAWVGTRAVLAKNELQSAVPLASEIQRQLVAGDPQAARATAAELTRHAENAAGLTSDPIWRISEAVPLLGGNLIAARELAAVVEDISKNAVTPLTRIAGEISLSDFKPVNGFVNVQPLIAVQPEVSTASDVLNEAAAHISTIDTAQTLDAVQVAADTLYSAVAEAAKSADILSRAVRLMPSMLGVTTTGTPGPRNYLILFQNPAELRSTGGIPGAVALVHTENGGMHMVEQASSPDFRRYPTPVLALPPETRNLYGDTTGRMIQDINLTPDFTLTARLAQEMWRLNFGQQVDGVLSIDPVALSYLLGATGPITLPTGDILSSENAVQLLLSDVYKRYPDPIDQDNYFANAAAAVFQTVASGNAEPRAMLEAFAKAGAENRVLVWSAHPDDQAILADTTLSGSLPITDERATRFGIYLNDTTGGKMGLYLDARIGVGRANCPVNFGLKYGVTLTLTNTAPPDAATALPSYVTGGGNFGVVPGNVNTTVSVYGAPGMENALTTRDGVQVTFQPSTDSGHPVSVLPIDLAPGQSTQLYFTWLSLARTSGDLFTQSTPVINRHDTEKIRVVCS